MKRRGSVVLLWIAAAVVAVMPLATGCGGGGGSSPISYDGIETQSAVAGSTAGAFLTNGYNGVDVASVLAGTMVNTGAAIPIALSAESMPQDLPTVVPVEELIECDVDGSFTVYFMVNTITDDFEGTISYDGCSPRPGESISGDADAFGSGFNQSGPPDVTDLTFTDLTIVKWGETWKASGNLVVENTVFEAESAAVPLVFRTDATISVEDLILKSPDGVTMKMEYGTIEVDLDEGGYWLDINDLGGKGARFYHPDFGYLYIATFDPIGVDDKTGMPFEGVVVLTDEISAEYAWLRFDTFPGGTTWDLWLDGGNNLPDFGGGIEPDDTPIANGTFEGGEFTESVPG